MPSLTCAQDKWEEGRYTWAKPNSPWIHCDVHRAGPGRGGARSVWVSTAFSGTSPHLAQGVGSVTGCWRTEWLIGEISCLKHLTFWRRDGRQKTKWAPGRYLWFFLIIDFGIWNIFDYSQWIWERKLTEIHNNLRCFPSKSICMESNVTEFAN